MVRLRALVGRKLPKEKIIQMLPVLKDIGESLKSTEKKAYAAMYFRKHLLDRGGDFAIHIVEQMPNVHAELKEHVALLREIGIIINKASRNKLKKKTVRNIIQEIHNFCKRIPGENHFYENLYKEAKHAYQDSPRPGDKFIFKHDEAMYEFYASCFSILDGLSNYAGQLDELLDSKPPLTFRSPYR